MLVQSKIKKWGNSQGVILNKDVLAAVQLSVDDCVEIYTDNGYIVKKKSLISHTEA